MTSKREAQEAADLQRRRCIEWLLPYLREGWPKFCTKDELRRAAQDAIGVFNASFNAAWIWVIEETARHDWYEPLHRRANPANPRRLAQ